MGKYPLGEMSGRGNVKSEKCPVGEIAARGIVQSEKWQVGEVSVGELSSRGCVSRGSVGRGNVQGHSKYARVKKQDQKQPFMQYMTLTNKMKPSF